MRLLLLPFSARYILLTLAFAATGVLAVHIWRNPDGGALLLLPLAGFGALTLLGLRDLLQRKHAILRNYPIAAHIRFLLENIRPEMRQYFFECDKDGMPFPRDKRAIVYQRAKKTLDKRPFGTQYDVYRQRATNGCITRSRRSRRARSRSASSIGGPDCTQPYSASVFNISAMSFGSLSANAIRALNRGAKLGGFAHDTGEGGFSPYHREHGGDIIWEIGSGYFGCRNARRHVLRPSASPRPPRSTADQDDRDQAQPGRQAGPRRRAAGRQGDARDRPHPRRARWARTASRRRAIAPSRRPSS